jgi:hypothetical protein
VAVRLTNRPAKVPWLITSGHTASVTLTFEDDNGALDLSNRTFDAGWQQYAGVGTATTITVDDSDSASGQLILTIDDSATTGVAGRYVWWLRETVDGEPMPLLDGTLEIIPIGAAGISGAANAMSFAVGDQIQVVSSAVVGNSGASTLDELDDVTITAAASGDILRHNGSAWVDTPGTTHFEAAGAVAAHAAAADPHPTYLTAAEGAAAYQPLDSDLTAIAALTTTSFGRALLALADAAALRTAAALAAVASSGSASDLSTGTVATARLGSGSASASTYLRGDQTWAAVPSTPGAVQALMAERFI